jgi:hypothetical protein
MGKRLLPFRQYNEHDVINMFALDDSVLSATENITGFHSGDAGVFVKVSAGNLDLDPVTYGTDSYLGKTDYPSAGDVALGITLWETAKYDENGEKLLYYPQKAAENQVLLPGQAVPVATRGVFTVSSRAYDGTLTPGAKFKLSANAGKITGAVLSDVSGIGTILATGSRGANGATIADKYSGTYAVIKLEA